jgi:Phage tail assembly chaperone proteins, E, or 41 or 14
MDEIPLAPTPLTPEELIAKRRAAEVPRFQPQQLVASPQSIAPAPASQAPSTSNGEAQETPGLVIVKLKHPIEFDNKRYEELRLDFDSLIADDLIRAETTWRALEPTTFAVITSTHAGYQAAIAAEAAKVPIAVIRKLHRKDWRRVSQATFNALGESD